MSVKRPLVINQPYFARFARELRSEIGLTQEQLAVELGVTCSSVNRWENQRGKPSPLATQRVEELLQKLGARGRELLEQYSAK